MHDFFMDAPSFFYPFFFGIENLDNEDLDPLPIRLYNEGYDVWLGNMRGTRYSRKHETLDSSDVNSEYWKFSLAEKGMLDVPAAITKIKAVSGA